MDQVYIKVSHKRVEREDSFEEWLRIHKKINTVFEQEYFCYWQEEIEMFIHCSFFMRKEDLEKWASRLEEYAKRRKFGNMPKAPSFSDLAKMTYAIAADRACLLDLTPEISQNLKDGDSLC